MLEASSVLLTKRVKSKSIQISIIILPMDISCGGISMRWQKLNNLKRD